MKLKRPPSVSPATITRFLEDARLAVRRGELKLAIETLERARGLAPGNPDILLELGWIHGLRFEMDKASDYFEKAVQFSGKKTQALNAAGLKAYEFFNLELAERYLRRAAEQPDATADNWIRLARILEGLRRMPESAQCIERAAKLDASSPEIPFVRAQLTRAEGRWEEAEKLFRSVLPATDGLLRAQCGYELAAALDRQGRYDEAMTALIEAKALFQDQVESLSHKRELFNSRRRKALAGMSAGMMQRWFDLGPQLKPARRLALLCGHPRSGTTLLEQVLDSHPDMVATEETRSFHWEVCVPLARTQVSDPEIPGFSAIQLKLETLESAPADLLRRVRENYFRSMERCLGQPLGGRLLVDKNPVMSMLTNGFMRVFPDAKLLMALRDPRDVIFSCFMQFMPGSVELRRTSHLRLADLVEQYLDEMNVWLTLKPLMPGHYLEVRYEDMVEDLESVARKTLDFLGVPWDPAVLRFHEQAEQKVSRLANYALVSKPVYKRSRQRWRHYEKYFEPYQEKLAPFVKAFGYEG